MIPVTLGLGLINVSAVIGTVFAAKLIDPTDGAGCDRQGVPHLHAPAGDVLGRGRDRAVSVARAARDARRPSRLPRTVSLGVRQINFLLVPAAVTSAVLAEPIVRLLYQRGAFEPNQTTVVAGALAAFSLGLSFNGMMLMLNRAFFSLQSAVDADRRSHCANLALNDGALRGPLPRRHVGDPARDLARQHRRRGDPRSSCCGAASARSTFARSPARSCSSLPRRPCSPASPTVSGAGSTRRSGAAFLAQLVSLGSALLAGAAVYLVCCRLLGVREIEALLTLRDRFRRELITHGPGPHPQLLDHRPHRPREVDPGRPHPRGHGHGLRPRDARPAARHDGSRARARNHDQGAGGARRVEGPPAQPDRHAGPRRLHLRGLALAPGLRGRPARRRRGPGDRGADARERLPRDRERPRDRAGREQDRPAAGEPRRGRGRGRRADRRGPGARAPDLGQDRSGSRGRARRDRRARSRAGRRSRRACARAHLRLRVRRLPRRRRVRPRRRRALPSPRAAPCDGARGRASRRRSSASSRRR